MSNWSSFKNDQLIMESWRFHINEAPSPIPRFASDADVSDLSSEAQAILTSIQVGPVANRYASLERFINRLRSTAGTDPVKIRQLRGATELMNFAMQSDEGKRLMPDPSASPAPTPSPTPTPTPSPTGSAGTGSAGTGSAGTGSAGGPNPLEGLTVKQLIDIVNTGSATEAEAARVELRARVQASRARGYDFGSYRAGSSGRRTSSVAGRGGGAEIGPAGSGGSAAAGSAAPAASAICILLNLS